MKFIAVIISLVLIAYFTGCSGSSGTEENDNSEIITEKTTEIINSESSVILTTAKEEQNNFMYSPETDSTYLYWLNNELIILNGSTKCNIFALNVLSKAGYKTPEENALAADLFDTTLFTDVLPVIGINDISKAVKGDLLIWNYHVIIFDSPVYIGNDEYALAWWAGTRLSDNGNNIKNNVCFGKYKLDGDFVIRRPLKK
ncbi:MAG TPA: hypothetical protein PKC91_00385 [Ignavibacteria bacterium]|nr:hypothetical protein [Ignavibacteria bacterium]